MKEEAHPSQTFLHLLQQGVLPDEQVPTKLFEATQSFVLFVGYPRSGHSLIGSLLDAHPQMVISNELNVLPLFEAGQSRLHIFQQILKNAVDLGQSGRENSGYDYQVPGQWQGRFEQIRVIGDKKGGGSAKFLGKAADGGILELVRRETQLPLKFIHVIRNPFDSLSTAIRRVLRRRPEANLEEIFEKKCSNYFFRAQTIQDLIQRGEHDICSIHFREFVQAPKTHLQELCDFLAVDAPADYLTACASIVWPKARKSRQQVDFWTPAYIQRVEEGIQNIDFFSPYTFD
ncbi:MAG: hypothetical protein AAFP19_18300 [Bacteroidota bacterium]